MLALFNGFDLVLVWQRESIKLFRELIVMLRFTRIYEKGKD
jgi:hypothetical protein